MPNAFAYLMLSIWPLVCVALFRRLPFERALVWSILGGYLALPPLTSFDLPLVPAMDKSSIPSISAVVICVFMLHRRVALWPQSGLARALAALFLLSVIPTVLTNGDPLVFKAIENSEPISFVTSQRPGLSLHDLLSVIVNQAIVLLPFLLARQFLATETGLREILLALVVGGLIYSLPALVEIRLSPQLNIWIYGFFQHDFAQMIRDGGYRPIVFLPHALWLALFMTMAVLAAAALSRRAEGETRVRFLLATLYLLGILYLCKSLASQLYALAFLPLVLLTGPKLQIRVALLLALIAVIYPMLRNAGLIPLEAILDQAAAIDPERANSLQYRFGNEERLLVRAHEKPWFGWGGWGRNLILDPETSEILTVPDGRWIIVFGTFGWAGYIAEMGLLAVPLALLGLRMRRLPAAELSPVVAPVALLLAVTMLDMLLNATLIPFTWMCAGAVLGYAERLKSPAAAAAGRAPLFGQGPVIGRRDPDKRRRTLL